MGWFVEHWFALLLLSVYTVLLMRNAWIGRRVADGMSGYYVGRRNMGGVAIGVSFFATFASTNSYIGHAGKGYEFGLIWLFMALCLVLFTYLSWRWVGPKLRAFVTEFDALTLPDYLGARFLGAADQPRHPIRWAAALVIVFSSLLYLIAIFKGAGHLFEYFFGISYQAAVVITLAIVVVYTSVGGFVSVVRTDVLQGGLMVMGALLIFYFVTDAAGGVGALASLYEMPDKAFLFELNGGIPFAVLAGISLSGALKLLVDPRQLSRFFALKDDREIRRGIWVAVFGLLVVQACLFPIGVYAHLLLSSVTDTDVIVPTLITDPAIFPFWVADFLIVAVVAAAMSSMDSVLLVAASTAFKNLVAPFAGEAHPLLWTRCALFGFAIVAALIALNPPGDIVELTIFSGSLYAVCFLPAVLLGLHWGHGSATAVLSSMLVGTAVLLAWLALDLNLYLHEVFPALATSVVTYVLVSLSTTTVAIVRNRCL